MATIKDIAQLAQVSLSTVSIVLNGQSEQRKISVKTQQKVWNAVKELEYKPNIAARGLRENSHGSNTIVTLYWSNDFRTSLLSRFLKGLQRITENSEQRIEIHIVTYSNDKLYEHEELMTGKRCHAAIIANASKKDMEFLEKITPPMPVVLYNRSSENYYGITVDNYRMGQLAAQALLQKKHQEIAILTAEYIFPGMEQRDLGFIDTFKNNRINISDSQIICTENSINGGCLGCEKILSNKNKISAIYCASDAIALGVIYTLHQHNVRIPEEISVISIGNGDNEYSQYTIPPLSNVYLPMEDMAEKCLITLLNLLNHQEIPEKTILLETPLQLRQTT